MAESVFDRRVPAQTVDLGPTRDSGAADMPTHVVGDIGGELFNEFWAFWARPYEAHIPF